MPSRFVAIFVSGSTRALSLAWSTVGGLLGLALLPVMEGWVSLPLGLAGGLYVALLIANHNQANDIDRLRGEVAEFKNAEPRIKFQKVGGPTQIDVAKVGEAVRRMEVRQLWFINHPEIRGVGAVAKQLTAQIEFCDAGWNRQLEPIVGQWAITPFHEHVGWGEIANLKSSIDLGLSPTRGKLQLLCQRRGFLDGAGEREVYALAGENLHAYPGSWQHPKYRLRRNVVRVRVLVASDNMNEQEFRFLIDREENGTVRDVKALTP